MITWNTFRDKTLYDVDLRTFVTEAGNPSDGVNTRSVIYHASDGATTQIENHTEAGGSDGTDPPVGFGSTLIDNATAHTFRSSFSDGTVFNDTSVSTTTPYGFSYQSTTSETYTSTYTTTSVVDTTTDSYYVSFNALGYRTQTTAAISNQSSSSTVFGTDSVTIDYFCSGTYASTRTVVSGFASSANTYQELGTVVSQESSDWLWSLTATPNTDLGWSSNASFLSELASSFTSTSVFWPLGTSYEVAFAGYNGTASAHTVTVSGAPTTIEIGSINETTNLVAFTSGDHFSRQVYEVTGLDPFSTATGATIGNPDTTFELFHSADTSAVSYVARTSFSATVPTIYPARLTDYSTTSLPGITTDYSSTTSAISVNEFMNVSTASDLLITAGVQSTSTDYLWLTHYSYDDAKTIYGPIFPTGVFASNSNTSSAYDNLQIGGATIFYPYTSSILSNVVTPVPTNTATRDGETTWRYSWSDLILYYTKGITGTVADGTRTRIVTHSTTSNGEFGGLGVAQTYYSSEASGFGGNCFIPRNSQTEYVPRHAAYVTTRSANGSTSSEKTIYQSTYSSAQTGAFVVERPAEAFVTYNTHDGGAQVPVFVYARNYDG